MFPGEFGDFTLFIPMGRPQQFLLVIQPFFSDLDVGAFAFVVSSFLRQIQNNVSRRVWGLHFVYPNGSGPSNFFLSRWMTMNEEVGTTR